MCIPLIDFLFVDYHDFFVNLKKIFSLQFGFFKRKKVPGSESAVSSLLELNFLFFLILVICKGKTKNF